MDSLYEAPVFPKGVLRGAGGALVLGKGGENTARLQITRRVLSVVEEVRQVHGVFAKGI